MSVKRQQSGIVIDAYLANTSPVERQTAYAASEQLAADRPIADTVCMLVTAAHQEAPNIPTAVAQYAGQVGCGPFTVVVGLNCPETYAETAAVQDSVDAVEAAQRQHPELDIRTSFTTYRHAAPPIGMIRRDLWQAVLARAQHDGTLQSGLQDLITTSHDADLVGLSPNYVATVQDHYSNRPTSTAMPYRPARVTPLRHGRSAAHPHSATALHLHDAVAHAARVWYAASIVLPASHYAYVGGFDSTARCDETFNMLGSTRPTQSMAGIEMVTSPQRYLAYMAERGFDVWQGNRDFGTHDTYRNAEYTPQDISIETRNTLLTETQQQLADVLAYRAGVLLRKSMARDASSPDAEALAWLQAEFAPVVAALKEVDTDVQELYAPLISDEGMRNIIDMAIQKRVAERAETQRALEMVERANPVRVTAMGRD